MLPGQTFSCGQTSLLEKSFMRLPTGRTPFQQKETQMKQGIVRESKHISLGPSRQTEVHFMAFAGDEEGHCLA